MLRWIVLAVVVVALTAVATFFSVNALDSESASVPVAAVAGPQPAVEVPEPLVYEFGAMPQFSTGTHTWEFKNVGDGDLELWFESSTCSCTVAKLKSPDDATKKTLVVKPHESTTIDLEWQTKHFRDAYAKGATIGTNDPKRPSVSITAKGTVNPPVIVYPSELIAFNAISNEEAHTAKIAVYSMDRPETKVTKLTNSRPNFIAAKVKPLTDELCKQLKIKAGSEIEVEIKPGMPLGRFADDLVIETNHPLRSEVKVAIGGVVMGPISHIPDRVRMPNVSSTAGATSTMTLLVRGGKPTHFAVAFKPPRIQVEVFPDDTSTQKGRYKMIVTVPAGAQAGPVDGDIVLTTDHPGASEIRIPVGILISNSGG